MSQISNGLPKLIQPEEKSTSGKIMFRVSFGKYILLSLIIKGQNLGRQTSVLDTVSLLIKLQSSI